MSTLTMPRNRIRWPDSLVPIITRLNTTWHEKALWVYTAIVLAHWLEHLVQGYQVYVLGWPRPASLGALGLIFPVLVKTEALHFGYAVFMLGGLIILRPGFQGRSRLWWDISLAIQGWHFIEHAVLQGQAIAGAYLFNAAQPISIVQVWVPRVELHLLYNALVFVPMVIAMVYHKHPPAKDREKFEPVCTCSL
ncbi:MAG: hypothetical protein R3335_13555 [Anaerolineales bacterium]|nr:hypothetical protein [Anaerolineales bacterium]